jgi:GNAT superfamily N-acetyltransferase
VIQVRRATGSDIEELIRLRKLMHESMKSPGLDSPGWKRAATDMLREELAARRPTLAAFVIDGGDGGLAACATGIIHRRVPSPTNPGGRVGYVFNVSTDPGYRRRGYSRACMESLLGWFRKRQVPRIDLRASADGEPLYASLGFVRTGDPSMVLNLA